MSEFVDQILLRFLEQNFVEDLLKNQIGLATLFNLTYEVEDIELKDIGLANIQRRQFQMPAFETIRLTGTEEQIIPTPERVKVDYAQHRHGRLAWVEIFLEILVVGKVYVTGAPLESITSEILAEKLGALASLNELKTKLQALFPDSIVAAFFAQTKISSVEEFRRRGDLFLKFVFKEPPPYNPEFPPDLRTYPINLCVQCQPELKISEALQSAKLCRSILENEKNFAQYFSGGQIKRPYVFLVIFPEEAAAAVGLIPGLDAAQIKASVRDLFAVEEMLAHFITLV